MKFTQFFCLFFISCNTLAQNFAFVQDKDGFSNIREMASLNSKVTNTVKNQELVRCVSTDESPKFCYINSSLGKNGYIYKDRLNFFKGYGKLKLSNYKGSEVNFKGRNLEVLIKANPNIGNKEFKILKNKSGNKIYLNGNEVYGTDESLPNQKFSQIDSIFVKTKKYKILIGEEDLQGLFFPNNGLAKYNELADFQIFYLKDKIYILNTFNNGGAGEYNIGFYINDGKVLGKYFWRTSL